MRKSLALVSVAGSLVSVFAVRAQEPVTLPVPPASSVGLAVPFPAGELRPDDKTASPDLRDIAARSGRIFDGVLVAKHTAIPAGMRVLVTEYTFAVNEWFSVGQRNRTVTIRETGGEEADGSGMATCESHRLTLNGRYLVFLRQDADEVLFPMDRVFQVMDTGATVADESGRIVVGLSGSVPILRVDPSLPGIEYLRPAPGGGGPTLYSGPTETFDPPVAITPVPQPELPPIPAERMFKLLRQDGARPPAGAGPAGLNSQAVGAIDWNYCGYVNGATGAHNFATWLPDNNNFNWFNDAEFFWDQEVNYSGAGGWIFAFLASGGNPIRNEAPVANNNRDQGGVPSDAQMIAGGYGSWAANGSPNGICFFWFSNGSCTRLRETDVFINPVNGANELQFRKSIVHEMGHALGLGHEDRYVADMVSGSWRVPPNYGYTDYLRLDDRQGVRSMLLAANAGGGGVWSLANWRDLGTYSQSHPNVGFSADVGPNVVQLSTYNANVGDSITISHLHMENRGRTAFSGPVTFRVYLSTDPVITAADTQVASLGWGSYGAEAASYNFALNFTVPNVPTGNYYVGWICTAGEAQLATGNDTGIMRYDSSNSFALRTLGVSNNVPINDSCGGALPVTTGTYNGSTAFATPDGSSCAPSGKDVWYTFNSPCAGTLSLDTCGSAFDTVLSVHSGCPGTAGNSVACNDDSCGLQSALSTPVAAGVAYYIRVAGYDYGAGDIRNGAFGLNVAFVANAPANDNCGSAILIGNGTTAGSTICANTDGSATCGASNGSPDVWYRWVAPGNGALHVDTCGSGYDTVVSVHTGCPGTAANDIGCNDDSCGLQSSVDVPVSSGQTYLIRVSGWAGSYGTFTLHTGFAPANDYCANALPIFNGVTPFTTVGATTDGPYEATCSFGFNDPQVNQDIWYTYVATCTGTATISLCGSDYDSKVAIYDGAGCPSPFSQDTAIACNDDFCNLQSQVSWPTVAGHSYKVRIGGYSIYSGSGNITLGCVAAAACYPNCDHSTAVPCLNVNDFACFLNAFAAGQPYANCDNSTTVPVLNVNDFACFLNAFAAGCTGC